MQRHNRVRVLLDRVNTQRDSCPLRPRKGRPNQRASPRPDNHKGRVLALVRRARLNHVEQAAVHSLLVALVLDRVLLEHLVGLRFEVVHQRLQGSLEIVLVRGLVLLLVVQHNLVTSLRHIRFVVPQVSPGCYHLRVGLTLEHDLDLVRVHAQQEVVLRLGKSAPRLLQHEQVGVNDKTTHRLRNPTRKDAWAGHFVRQFQHDTEPRVVRAERAEAVPTEPRFVLVLTLNPERNAHPDVEVHRLHQTRHQQARQVGCAPLRRGHEHRGEGRVGSVADLPCQRLPAPLRQGRVSGVAVDPSADLTNNHTAPLRHLQDLLTAPERLKFVATEQGKADEVAPLRAHRRQRIVQARVPPAPRLNRSSGCPTPRR
eukprot:Hpha_TRINITY_DN11832_c0_g1::TRINITY_DN11832_c0_g1_i1::g.2184::m.2184